MTHRIPFNKPCLIGPELAYLAQAVAGGHTSSNGPFTQSVEQLLETKFGVARALLTTSCTSALEMAALLCDLMPGDEVIMPSYTFVSAANAVVLRGATPVFVDIRRDTLNIDERLIEAAITPRTRAIFVVHYAGQACEMDAIMAIAERHGLVVVEDAAQAVYSRYNDRWLGTIGHLGCYSFHETKNIACGEGGALLINDDRFTARAEVLRDKGTNRRQFQLGVVDKYTWVDVGSSYGPSDMLAAFLLGQLENMEAITARRREIFYRYSVGLRALADAGDISLPEIASRRTINYHIFYVMTADFDERTDLIEFLRQSGIIAVFHYVPLHSSPFFRSVSTTDAALPVTDDVSRRLLRLPMYFDLTDEQVDEIAEQIGEFYRTRKRRS
jgi:dTDP-4-amino-4,6-dideoxygalactose transaminase